MKLDERVGGNEHGPVRSGHRMEVREQHQPFLKLNTSEQILKCLGDPRGSKSQEQTGPPVFSENIHGSVHRVRNSGSRPAHDQQG